MQGKNQPIFDQDLDDISNKNGDIIFSILAIIAIAIDYKSGHFINGASMLVIAIWVLSVVFSLLQAVDFMGLTKRSHFIFSIYMLLMTVAMIFVLPLGSLYSFIILQLIFQAHYWFGYKGSVSTVGIFTCAAVAAMFYQYGGWDYYAFATIFRMVVMVVLGSIAIVGTHDLAKKRILNERAARKQTEIQERRLSALMNSMSDAVIATDHEGVIVEYNRVAAQMIDDEFEMRQRSFSEVFNIHNASGEHVDIIAQVRNIKKSIERDDLYHVFSDKKRLNLNILASPVRLPTEEGGVLGFTLVLRDITRSKTVEEQRSEFITTVTRELETPAEVVEDNLDKASGDGGDKASLLASAQDNAHFINRLIGDLGILAMIEQDKQTIDIRAFAIKDVLDYIDERYRPIAEARGNQFKITVSQEIDHIVSNQRFVTEIVSSLVSNAIKNTKNGQILVTASRLPSSHTIIEIADSGIGLAKGNLAHVFDKFYQSGEDNEREAGAAGFGLYVSKRLAEQINAKIMITTEFDKGSTFSLMIPPDPGLH